MHCAFFLKTRACRFGDRYICISYVTSTPSSILWPVILCNGERSREMKLIVPQEFLLT